MPSSQQGVGRQRGGITMLVVIGEGGVLLAVVLVLGSVERRRVQHF